MCGIVGYVGKRAAADIIIDGLRKLEYRGYDSAGICTIDSGRAYIRRSEGKLINLERLVNADPVGGTLGIGHTRWATHGKPSEVNAHPHQAGSVIVVHNGIIENYLQLRKQLQAAGHSFKSETDTEVISHLIESRMKAKAPFEVAVREALAQLVGAYAICVVCQDEPDVLVAAKSGAPMVVGLAESEFFIASDIPAILAYTRTMVFLEDGDVAVFKRGGFALSTTAGQPVQRASRHIDWSPHMAEKGGYRHFMLKEIHEQPRAIRDTIAGRILSEKGDVHLEDLALAEEDLWVINRICIVACGTSWHAGLVGKFLLEEQCRIPVEVDIASEFRYRNPVIDHRTLVVPISQSGETADTLAAMREARRRGAKAVAICNVVDSSIAREADGVIYTHAGPEIGVASTKAFVTQLVALYLLTIRLGRSRGHVSLEQGQKLISAIVHSPALVEEALQLNDQVEKIARNYLDARDFLYLGRGCAYPIALEGALKLKEISYIHAEGYPAGEMKHGPIALIDEHMPVVVLAPRGPSYEKVFSNMEEAIARGGRVIGVCSAGDAAIRDKAEAVLEIPDGSAELMPILLSIPMQLLAYHVAVLKGTDVDQPRNLAKSVTVE